MMRAVILLALFATVGAQVLRNVCRPTEIVFILDHSENAKKASTEEGGPEFQLLKNAWASYMTDLQNSGDSLFKIWAWSYSSRATPQELVPRNSNPSQSKNPAIGTLVNGGSWTYMGLDQIRNARPTQANNLVIIISAQGSLNNNRRQQASASYNAIRNNGWNTYVIGVKSSPIIDEAELRICNGGRNPVILDDGRVTNKKSYSLLGRELANIKNTILCPPVQITQPPTLPPIRTQPPSTGICSNCRITGGYGFDRHPENCDSFYQCMPDGSYILKQCAAGLVWNDVIGTCVRAYNFVCPTGRCNVGLVGTTYVSGVCCNHFFECNGTALIYRQCATGQIYDSARRSCINAASPVAQCAAMGGYYCNVRMNNNVADCGAYAPDPTGNPCKFLHSGVIKTVPAGTVWDQTKCSLVKSDACKSIGIFGDKSLNSRCSALVISDMESGNPLVYSERTPTAKLFVKLTPAVVNSRGMLLFRPTLGDASAYYYFFNNNEIPYDSAFRMVFGLSSTATIGQEYDLFSNNFCPLCPATMGATVRKTSASTLVITTRFVDSITGSIVSSSTTCNNVQPQGMLDMVVVWGRSDVHGVIKVMGQNKVVQNRVQIQSVQHSAMSNITPNKCGILLGGGSHVNFAGTIDLFAYYSLCSNIDEVLNL